MGNRGKEIVDQKYEWKSMIEEFTDIVVRGTPLEQQR